MTAETVAGVDWAGGEWLAVVLDGDAEREGGIDCVVSEGMEPLWNARGIDRILIDVPIGLPEDAETLARREAVDAAARSATGRPSSVFPVPSRNACAAASEGADYEAVTERNRADLGKGLSRQSYHIAPAVGDVDAFLRRDESAAERVMEAHPEVCFRGLRGRQLTHSKTTARGVGERLAALDGHLDDPGSAFGRLCRGLVDGGDADDGATADDVIDALCLAVVARRPREDLRFLPGDEAYRDREGIPMRMAYCGAEPLG